MPHVLIIDDDSRALALNEAALASGGYTTCTAGSADEGRRALFASPTDLLILEPLVPGSYDGFALVRQIAADHPRLPIIVLTRADEQLSASVRDAQDRDGGWLPVHRYLEKPVEPEVVRDEVDHVLHELSEPAP